MNNASLRRGLAGAVPVFAATLLATASPALASTATVSSSDSAPPARTNATTQHESSAETLLFRLVNAERERHGLTPLRLQQTLRNYARHHAAEQLRHRNLWHDLDEYERWVPRGATVIGENVGASDSVPEVNEAYMRSPGHRANILSREYNYVGIGVQVAADGEMYSSLDFMRCTGRTCHR